MKKNLLPSLLLIGSLLFVFSCKKKDDPKPSITEDALVGSWSLTALTTTVTFQGQTQTDNNLEDQDDCAKDDLWDFRANKDLFGLEGAIKCDPSDPNEEKFGRWELRNGGRNLAFVDLDGEFADELGSDELELVVESLQGNTLKLSANETDNSLGFTVTAKLNITFIKK